MANQTIVSPRMRLVSCSYIVLLNIDNIECFKEKIESELIYFCIKSLEADVEIEVFPSCLAGLITKGCLNSDACVSPMSCCEGDLCNNAIPTGPSVILLLVSSAIITLFL